MVRLAKVLLVLAGLVFVLNGKVFPAVNKDRQLRSEHFIINYHESLGYEYVNKIKNLCEDYYRVISQEFRLVRDKLWLWEDRAKIFIAKDKEAYSSRFNCPAWSTACVNYRDKVIYTYPDQVNFSPILMHELTHIIFREYVGLDKFPLWLDEGVSMYMEDKYSRNSPRKRDITFLKQAIKDNSYIKLTDLNKITLLNLGGQTRDYVGLFYAEAFSLVSFIIKKYGRDRFSQFLYFLRKGDSYEDALAKAVYSVKGWEELEAKWKRFYQE